ncbi:unnamed protein product [Amoebophrya sp. A25]|nr:unnamed protein product [Amoebophrya sp. A25]|eukprot:GSA25T00012462001.1
MSAPAKRSSTASQKAAAGGGKAKAGCFGNYMIWMSGKYMLGDVNYYTKKYNEKCPGFLMPDEQIEFVFKFFEKKVIFTDKRIIRKSGSGNINLETIAYSAVGAYEIVTPSNKLDQDGELLIYTTMDEFPCVSFSIAKDGDLDLKKLMQFVNQGMLAARAPAAAQKFNAVENNAEIGDSFTTFLSSDAAQMPAEEAQSTFAAILHPMETVAFCFKRGYDFTMLTNMRMFFIDQQGTFSSTYVYTSVMWQSVRAFSVESGSTFDNDAEFVLYTNMMGKRQFKQELKKTVDILSIQAFISDMCCGTEVLPRVTGEMDAPDVDEKKEEGFWNSLTGNVGMLMNSAEAEKMFKEDKKLLAEQESIELAYKAKKDFFLFTTKRFIVVDHKAGFFGMNAKDEYISIPYKSIKGFSVQSAGSWFDKDSEMMLWTDIAPNDDILKEQGEGEDRSVYWVLNPGLSFRSFDFKKDQIDLLLLHKLLTAYVCPRVPDAEDAAPMDFRECGKAEGAIEALMSWATGDAREVDPAQVQAGIQDWLSPGETVQLAFKAGRDLHLFTNLRLFYIDPQGFFGKKVEYRSFPYSSFAGYSVQHEIGTWDADVEIRMFPKCQWEPYLSLELMQGKVDVMKIQAFLSRKILTKMDVDVSELADQSGASETMGETFWDWIKGDDARALDPQMAQDMLAAFLIPAEKVQMAFRAGPDLFVLTNKRVMVIDKEGKPWRRGGQSIEYKSLPWQHVKGMRCESASGFFDGDAEIFAFTDAPKGQYPQPNVIAGEGDDEGDAKQNYNENACCLEQDLRKGCEVKIFDIAQVMGNLLMTIEEP